MHPSNILLHRFFPWNRVNVSSRMSHGITHVWGSSLIPVTKLSSSGMTPYCVSSLRKAYWEHTSLSVITQPRFKMIRRNGRISIPFILIRLGLSNDHDRVENIDHGLTVTYSFGRGSPQNKSGTTTLNPSWAYSSATNWLWMYSGPKTLVNRIIVCRFSLSLGVGPTTYVRNPCKSWNWPRGIRLSSWESWC